MTTVPFIRPEQTLGDVAIERVGASRVFHRYGLDFCCGGNTTIEEACDRDDLDVATVIEEIEKEPAGEADEEGMERWRTAPLRAVIDFILARFHEPHRAELPRLIALARRVEDVHADSSSCPEGLADLLEDISEHLEDHMQKEEQVLFPMISAGRGRLASRAIQVMNREHRELGDYLDRLRALADDYRPPEEACAAWRALYMGLSDFELALMQHAGLETNVLFPRALARRPVW